MKKRIISIAALIALMTAFPAKADREISVYLDGTKILFDADPIIIDGRTLVPMRSLFEAFGTNVTWNPDTRTATASKIGNIVQIPIDEYYISRCSVKIPIDVAATIINDYTYIPLRAVGESFDCTVWWDDDTSSVNITSNTETQGTIYLNADTVYYGQVKDNQANGYGQIFSSSDNELLFMGLFSYGDLLKGGAYGDDWIYTGEFKDYLPDGQGTLYNDEQTIIGHWVSGEPYGEMAIYDINGVFIGFSELNSSDNLAAYNEEVAKLTQVKEETINELTEEYIENTQIDFYSLPSVQELREEYKKKAEQAANAAAANVAAANGGNISSNGSVAAQKAYNEVINQGEEQIKELYEEYLQTLKENYDNAVKNVEDIYNGQIENLKRTYNIE